MLMFRKSCGAFFFVRGIVSFKGPTLVFVAIFVVFGNKNNFGGVRREIDVGYIARNKTEGATSFCCFRNFISF